MRIRELLEVFDRPATELTRMSGAETRRKYGLTDVLVAYEFSIDSKSYVVYFDDCAHTNYDFTVGFGIVKLEPGPGTRRKQVAHSMTNYNVPIAVLRHVFDAVQLFLTQWSPAVVSFMGQSTRHSEFYGKLVRYMRNKLPPGYFFATRNNPHTNSVERMMITNDTEMLTKDQRVARLNPSRI